MAEKRSEGKQLEPVSGLSCPKCQGTEVAELPPNAISPDPGFKCLSCGAILRGQTTIYLFAGIIAVGLLTVATGMVPLFGDDRDPRIVSYVRGPYGSVIPLYLLVLVFSVIQLFRPKPRRIRSGVRHNDEETP